MKFAGLVQIIVLFFLFLSSCNEKKENEIPTESMNIRLNSDSSVVELGGVPVYILEELQADTLNFSQWSDFFAVYEESQDPEMHDFQPVLSGTYSIEEQRVCFRPDSAFRKGASYFSRCYTKLLLREPSDILRPAKLTDLNSYIEFRFNLPGK